jgi:hypothetical protein
MSSVSIDSAVLADHIELLVLAHESENFSLGRILRLAELYWDADEAQTSFAMSVLAHRASMLGDRYPFKVSRSFIVRECNSPVYEALLGLTRSNWYYPRIGLLGIDSEKEFELIAEGCLNNFFGTGTKSLNFGWPSDVGRPLEFAPAVSWLATQIGVPVGTAYRPPRRKDGGVDIFVWRDFGDGRPGIPLMLVQATVQLDVLSKTRDVDKRLWSGWLSMDTDPLVALAIPGTLNNTELWNEISCNSLLLDRLRLSTLSGGPDAELLSRCRGIAAATRAVVQAQLEDE